MNIESRYQNCLSDVITLLQEATYRFITNQEVDLSKFFQYFKQFYRNMASLQQCFHPSKIKFTKSLSKISNLAQKIEFNKQKVISLQPQHIKRSQIKKSQKSYDEQPTNYKNSTQIDKTQELNVIGQIEQQEDFEPNVHFQVNEGSIQINKRKFENRVGTANEARHKMSVTIDFHKERPYTGSYKKSKQFRKSSQKILNNENGNRERYRSLTKYEKNESIDLIQTNIDYKSQHNGNNKVEKYQANTFHNIDRYSQPPTQKKIFNVGPRKSIYDFLEQQKKSRKNSTIVNDQFFESQLIKLPQKRKNKSFSRWSFKINKLL